MTAEALAVLKPRARRRLPPDDQIRSAYRCECEGRQAVLVLTEDAVFLHTLGSATVWVAKHHGVWVAREGTGTCLLRLYDRSFRIRIDPQVVGRAFQEISTAGDGTRATQAGKRPMRSNGHLLGPDDRLIVGCRYLGGVNVPLEGRLEVDLLFGASDIQIYQPNVTLDLGPAARLAYSAGFTVELSGPGRFTTGGGFGGGGFGLVDAAEGMAIAAALNLLTSRTHTASVIAVLSAAYEAFFLSETHTPDELRPLLAQVFLRGRQMASTAVGPSTGAPGAAGITESAVSVSPTEQSRPAEDLVAALERLATLHRAGALTDEEFRQAKARALGPQGA